jgi:hypothetical protein
VSADLAEKAIEEVTEPALKDEPNAPDEDGNSEGDGEE